MFFKVIFAKDGHYALKEISESHYEVIGLDWTIDPMIGRNVCGESLTLQGNLDPCALYADKVRIYIKNILFFNYFLKFNFMELFIG